MLLTEVSKKSTSNFLIQKLFLWESCMEKSTSQVKSGLMVWPRK
jgi:hypothetical protein